MEHPIQQEIRAWLDAHVENVSALSLQSGHSSSWLHKWINGDGHATIDDLVRIAGLLFGLNLPALTETEQKLLKAVRVLEEADRQDVLAYVELRARRTRREQSTGSSGPTEQTPQTIKRKARGRQ